MIPKLTYNTLILAMLACCYAIQGHAQATNSRSKSQKAVDVSCGAIVSHCSNSAMKAYRSYGLGQFIHWGIYSLPGNEWKGHRYNGASERIRTWNDASAPNHWTMTYDNLYKQFDPLNFDAGQWAKQAKKMGARYMIFTAKNQDGFALWPTKFSAYQVMNTPFNRDIVGEIVNAYTAEGIDVFLSFSIRDWRNPNYMTKKPVTAAEKTKFNHFLAFTKNQILELLDSYPKIKGVWFDGTDDESWMLAYQYFYQLEKDIRLKYPQIIIGLVFENDKYRNQYTDVQASLMGDYVQRWERRLPYDINCVKGKDWEALISITPQDLGYVRNWSGKYIKTTNDIIRLLMRTVAMNGNFVLNFGPDGTGEMHPEEDKIAAELAGWMTINREAVYGTKHAADFGMNEYGYFTQKEKDLYLTIFNRPVDNIVRISTPRIHKNILLSAQLLSDSTPLKLKQVDMGVALDKNMYYDILLPVQQESIRPFVIKIKLEN